MDFNADEFFALTGTIWETMLSLPIEPPCDGTVVNRPRSAAACIQITGAWSGAILLDCSDAVARRAASIMFAKEMPDVSIADLQDAIAELLNMIGGNFKALLPGTCFLSLPAVVEGGDYSARIPGTQLFGRVSFLCEGHLVSILVLEKLPERAAA